MDGKGLSILEHSLDSRVDNTTAAVGGFSASRCWLVDLEDGRRLFVKAADDEESLAGNRNEATVLDSIRSPHLPSFVGLFGNGRLLVTENLDAADWPAQPESVDDLWVAIKEIESHQGPPSLWQSFQGSGRDTWAGVLADDRFSSAVGLEPGWMLRHGSALANLSKQADTSGDRLVHGDLAPGNWCRDAASVWRLVDWASAHRGNPVVDEVIACVRLTRLSGSSSLSTNVVERPEFVAFVGGRFAGELLDIDWSVAPKQALLDRIGDIQASLRLTADLIGLPTPSFI